MNSVLSWLGLFILLFGLCGCGETTPNVAHPVSAQEDDIAMPPQGALTSEPQGTMGNNTGNIGY